MSLGVLYKCQKRLERQRRNSLLIQAEAELLPFRSNSFDVAHSAGDFNFYNDKRKAVKEMIRAAKPGTK
ncbi:MAG TPA: hypothetical protein DCL73_03650 [Treponema sp.]|nr:hypothetical protein [Treponema sp.]